MTRAVGLMVVIAACSGGQARPPEQSTHDTGARGETLDPFAADRIVVVGKRPMFCAVMIGKRTEGFCFYDIADCERGRAMAENDYDACAQLTSVACADDEHVLSHSVVRICTPSISACDAFIVERSKNPDYRVHQARCEVERFDHEAAASPP